jgi:predicted acylesterase/phospholipase RssA
MMEEYLPKSFESLQKPFYAWVVDTNTAEYKLFNSWNLQKIVLWSMSIPGIFPPVSYDKYSLVDWWVLNNFPVDLAKKEYPDHEVIWIALNKFQTNQKIKSAFDNLSVTFEVMMRSKLLQNTKKVDYLFYRELKIWPLSLNKKQMHETFALGYNDWIKMFWNTNQ